MILEGEIKDTKVSRFSADFQTKKKEKKESQFYSLPFGQAVANMYQPTNHFN